MKGRVRNSREDGSDPRLSEPLSFECSEYFHLADLRPISPLIYGLAFRVTKGGQRKFFASARSVGEYLDRSEIEVRRGLKELVELGLFELIQADKFQTNIYHVLSHTEWKAKHPGRCCEKLTIVHTAVGDPLGQALWKESGGRVAFKQFTVDNLRSFGLPDEIVVSEFSKFWGESGSKLSPQLVGRTFFRIFQIAAPGIQERLAVGAQA